MSVSRLNPTGCLLIPCPATGAEPAVPLRDALRQAGLRVVTFDWHAGKGLHDRLLKAYQAARNNEDTASLVAFGAGWEAALSIACQLPVTRIALMDISGKTEYPRGFEYRRLRAFARRNASFCVTDILTAAPSERIDSTAFMRLRRALCNCRVYCVNTSENSLNSHADALHSFVCRFIVNGELYDSQIAVQTV